MLPGKEAVLRKLKKYEPTRFMAKTSHYDKEAADSLSAGKTVKSNFLEQA